MKKLLFILCFVLTFSVSTVFANPNANITFVWNANSETDLAGYRLYQSNVPGFYTFGEGNQIIDILTGTETVTIRVHDGIWYWVLTAYDNHGNESGPSNEVTAIIDTISPSAPGGLNITIIIKIEQ